MWFSKRSSLLHPIRSLHSKTKNNSQNHRPYSYDEPDRNPPFSIYLHFTQKESGYFACHYKFRTIRICHSLDTSRWAIQSPRSTGQAWHLSMYGIHPMKSWSYHCKKYNNDIKDKSQHINWTNSINHSAKASRKYCCLKCTTWSIWNWAFPELQ